MFDFVGKFFKGRPDKKPGIVTGGHTESAREIKGATLRTNGVAYDNSLIENLEKDHESLVEIFGKIWKDGYEAEDYDMLSRHLAEFKTLFQSHLLKENVKFYAYLEQSIKNDKHSLGVVREFRRDMNGIASAVIGFCKKYSRPEFTQTSREEFKNEYKDIGKALVRRVQLEERDLYSLYAPS